MERINAIELFVLIVFPKLSVAMLPMMSGCGCTSTNTDWFRYKLKCVRISQSSASEEYNSIHMIAKYYDHDPTKFDYSLVTSNDVLILENTGRNTDIVFLFDSKMIIHAKYNVNVLYSLDFALAIQAKIVANHIILATPARYKKCEGSLSYKIDTVYRRSTDTLTYVIGQNWCIFKNTIRKTNVTTFTIKWIGRIEEHRNVLCVFRLADSNLESEPDAPNKLELSIYSDGKILSPRYVLESSTPVQMRKFLTRR